MAAYYQAVVTKDKGAYMKFFAPGSPWKLSTYYKDRLQTPIDVRKYSREELKTDIEGETGIHNVLFSSSEGFKYRLLLARNPIATWKWTGNECSIDRKDPKTDPICFVKWKKVGDQWSIDTVALTSTQSSNEGAKEEPKDTPAAPEAPEAPEMMEKKEAPKEPVASEKVETPAAP